MENNQYQTNETDWSRTGTVFYMLFLVVELILLFILGFIIFIFGIELPLFIYYIFLSTIVLLTFINYCRKPSAQRRVNLIVLNAIVFITNLVHTALYFRETKLELIEDATLLIGIAFVTFTSLSGFQLARQFQHKNQPTPSGPTENLEGDMIEID